MPRPKEPPEEAKVLAAMEPNRCYVVADLCAHFEDKYDATRATMWNRLEALAEQGDVARVKHANETVTYRRPPAE